MIIFLNFAPIDFMGGAEKWMLDMASKTSEKEETTLIDVSPKISNLYGKFVLKRSFNSHLHKNKQLNNTQKLNRVTLSFKSFVPFTKERMLVKKTFKRARIIYIKCELLEILISFYFGGIFVTEKTIGGIQSPLVYGEPISMFDRLHNIVYQSFFFKKYLQRIKKIHVLNRRDKNILQNHFKLFHVSELPDGIHIDISRKEEIKKRSDNRLHIIYVGVLSLRKGIDTLLQIIKHAPEEFVFHIIGAGPMKQEIENLADNKKCIYYGYLDDETLREVYKQSDVIVFPSRSEALGLVLLEAMSLGLQTVVPKGISLDVPKYIEHVAQSRNPDEYIEILKNILENKKNNTIERNKIMEYARNNFSTDVVYPKFLKEVLNIN